MEPIIKTKANLDYKPVKRKPMLPNTLTEAKTGKICECLRLGMSKSASAKAAGISNQLLSFWMKRGEETTEEDGTGFHTFFQRISQSITGCEEEHLKVVAKAGMEDGDWKASAWLLERRFREQWGKKTEIDVNNTLTLDSLLSHSGQEQLEAELPIQTLDAEFEPVDAED